MRLNNLYGKIAVIFLVLLLILAVVQLRITMQAYWDFVVEIDQKLNRSLAGDLAERFRPFLADSLDYAALEHTFHELMVMNPRVEIYLLDRAGGILAYFAEPEKIKRTAVDIDPVEQFLNEGTSVPLPLFGDDPRNPHRRKPFSVAPVTIGGNQAGYLYVILGGEQYDSIASMLKNSYIVKTSAVVLGGTFLIAGLAGLILFFLLTRRLRGMTAAVRDIEAGNYQRRIDARSEDEIGQLGRAFNRMSDALVGTLEKLKQNDALRRELVANVSHDLRTPLASVQGYLETILMKEPRLQPEERQQFLQVIHHNVTMLSRLVGELFELSRLEAKQAEPQYEPFSIAELVQDLTLDFQALAQEEQIRLSTVLPQDLPLVGGDIGMIERALVNLIENALHYTPREGTVSIALKQKSDGVQVSISDTGQGIATEDLPHIFDRFYRAQKTGPGRSSNTGLGLAIAQKIVETHNSILSVQSQEKVGTQFSFTLAFFRADARGTAS